MRKAPEVPSIIFPHHPDGQATTWMPASTSGSVTFSGNGSAHEPSSPLDLHLIHLLFRPEIVSKLLHVVIVLSCPYFLIQKLLFIYALAVLKTAQYVVILLSKTSSTYLIKH